MDHSGHTGGLFFMFGQCSAGQKREFLLKAVERHVLRPRDHHAPGRGEASVIIIPGRSVPLCGSVPVLSGFPGGCDHQLFTGKGQTHRNDP